MGLIKEGNDFSVLSDILGDEDHLGDMDFKVAGTKNGITSLQMDIKITGITFEIMEKALDQAKAGRQHILGEMNKAIKSSRKEFSKHTPKMETIKVDKKAVWDNRYYVTRPPELDADDAIVATSFKGCKKGWNELILLIRQQK